MERDGDGKRMKALEGIMCQEMVSWTGESRRSFALLTGVPISPTEDNVETVERGRSWR